MNRLVLVGCVARKLDRPAPAADLYVSTLFAKRRAYAEASGAPWRILSALHGILDPEAVVYPYSTKLTKPAIAAWSHEVRLGLARSGLTAGGLVEVHAGVDYVEGVRRAIAWLERFGDLELVLDAPLAGLSIGRQLAWYNARRTQHPSP